MSTPIENLFLVVISEFLSFVQWLQRYQLFGVPIIAYLLAIAVTSIAIDYIFG